MTFNAMTAPPDVNIIVCQRMTVIADRLPDVDRCGRIMGAKRVFSALHGFKMIRVHTALVAAKMIDHQTFRDRALEMLIGNAVSKKVLLLDCQFPIAVRSNRPMPRPTRAHVSARVWRKKLFRRVRWATHHATFFQVFQASAPPPRIVPAAFRNPPVLPMRPAMAAFSPSARSAPAWVVKFCPPCRMSRSSR